MVSHIILNQSCENKEARKVERVKYVAKKRTKERNERKLEEGKKKSGQTWLDKWLRKSDVLGGARPTLKSVLQQKKNDGLTNTISTLRQDSGTDALEPNSISDDCITSERPWSQAGEHNTDNLNVMSPDEICDEIIRDLIVDVMKNIILTCCRYVCIVMSSNEDKSAN